MPWNMPATVRTNPATSMDKTRLVGRLVRSKELVASTGTYCTMTISKPCEKITVRSVCV